MQNANSSLKKKAALGYAFFGALLLIISLYFFSQSDSVVVLMVSAFMLPAILLGCFFVQHCGEQRAYAKKYACLISVVGIVFIFLFPPIAVPDEMYHFKASYWYSDLMMGSIPSFNSSEFSLRSDDWNLVVRHQKGQVNSDEYEKIGNNFDWLSQGDATHLVKEPGLDFGSNPPQLKLPSALGITFARLLNLGSYPLFYLGRLFNLSYYIVLTTLAISIAPVGKKLFAAVSLLPISVHLAASYSYDAGIIGLAALFVALMLRAIYDKQKMGRREQFQVVLAGVLLAPCKVIYSAAALLVFLVPSSRFESKKHATFFRIGLLVCMVVSILALRLPAMFSMATGARGVQSHDGVTGLYYTAGDIVSDPIGSALMLARTVFQMFDFYWISAIGGTLGLFQGSISAPHYLVAAYLIIIVIAALPSEDDCLVPSTSTRLVGIACFFLSVLGAVGAMWIGWTFNTQSIIQGVQGRYFLPLLPVFLLAVRPVSFSAQKDTSLLVLKCLYTMNLIYAIYILFCGMQIVA